MGTPRSRTHATSLDVAKLAGLSRTTVSQILNGNDARFPQETRDRVTAAAAELRYRPWRAGRALVSGISDLIVIVVPDITFGSRLQETVERFAAESENLGLNAVVRYAGSDLTATVMTILDLRPAAVYHLSAFDTETVAQLEAAGTKVFPHPGADQNENSRFDRMVGRMQTEELLRVRERKLVYAALADDRVGPSGPLRGQGVAEAAADAGVPAPEVVPVPLDLPGAVKALESQFAHPVGPIGVACYNDEVAIAVLGAARGFHLNVPDQVAVVGMDRIDVGQLISPRLTTIAVNMPVLDAYFAAELSLLLGREQQLSAPDVTRHPESVVALVPGESS